MMADHQNSIRIAVVEEQVRGLREQHRSQSQSAQRRFDAIEEKMNELIAIINRGRGAYAASLILAGLIGSFMVKLGSVVSHFFQR